MVESVVDRKPRVVKYLNEDLCLSFEGGRLRRLDESLQSRRGFRRLIVSFESAHLLKHTI